MKTRIKYLLFGLLLSSAIAGAAINWGNLDIKGTLKLSGLTASLPALYLDSSKNVQAYASTTAAFDALSPLTTAGDTLGYASGHNVRVPVGTTGLVYTSGGGSVPNNWTVLAIAGGGTNNSSLGVANGTVYYGDGSKLVGLAPGSDSNVLTLVSGVPAWVAPGAAVAQPINFLINGAFDFWQRGTSVTIANTASTYQADKWYVKNSLGTNGVITFSRATGVTAGSLYGASVQITTAPTGSQTNGTELYQMIENPVTPSLYNQSASFNVLVKALTNVNQVGVQFCYKTTEAKCDSFIGSEQTCTVNTSTFANCTITNQALGTSMTTSGAVGVRIRITGVSSGNTYGLNNGFVAEQAMFNLGSTAGAFVRAGLTYGAEHYLVQRTIQKSYTQGLFQGDSSSNYQGAISWFEQGSTTNDIPVQLPVRMRTDSPTCNVYSPVTGTSNEIRDRNTNTDVAATVNDVGGTAFRVHISPISVTRLYSFQWFCDAEI